MDKVRNAVVDLLVQVEQDQSYSTISLKKVIEQQKWTAKDKGLLTELFYGTIQRKMTIDFYLAPYIQKSSAKLSHQSHHRKSKHQYFSL